MINFSKITGFDWDSGNERKNSDKHAVAKTESEQVFFNKPMLLMEDKTHSKFEHRFHALGYTNSNRLLHITFTLRLGNTLIRVISARDMHRKERNVYEQYKKNS